MVATDPFDPLPHVVVEAFPTFMHAHCDRCGSGTSWYLPFVRAHPECLREFHDKHKDCEVTP